MVEELRLTGSSKRSERNTLKGVKSETVLGREGETFTTESFDTEKKGNTGKSSMGTMTNRTIGESKVQMYSLNVELAE